MSGREDSVAERFRKDLRTFCASVKSIDMNAPANGADRYLNADEVFGMDGLFFLVEFKSRKFSLKDEKRKPSACRLCGRLSANPAAKKLHDKAHFAAWGEKQLKKPLKCFLGIYRSLICRPHVLPTCKFVTAKDCDDESWEASSLFLGEALQGQRGLNATDFTSYLKWLFEHTDSKEASAGFPLSLYVYTYNDQMEERVFERYRDFEMWADDAIAVKNAMSLPIP